MDWSLIDLRCLLTKNNTFLYNSGRRQSKPTKFARRNLQLRLKFNNQPSKSVPQIFLSRSVKEKGFLVHLTVTRSFSKLYCGRRN